MIEKMSFISIVAPKGDIDKIYEEHIEHYDIQLEYAPSEFKSAENLTPYIELNPYKELLNVATDISKRIDTLNDSSTSNVVDIPDSKDEATLLVKEITSYISIKNKAIDDLTNQLNECQTSYDKIAPFKELQYNVEDILHFKYIKFRFGRIPVENWAKFDTYLYSSSDSTFIKCSSDSKYVWGVYFVPGTEVDVVDAAYSSLHFERTYIPGSVHGMPEEACKELLEPIDSLTKQIAQLNAEIDDYLSARKRAFISAKQILTNASTTFDIRKYATCSGNNDDYNSFFFLCGWMTKQNALKLNKELNSLNNDEILCFIDEDQEHTNSVPPTKLKNPGFFKPYEMYTKMYGLPAYNEFDPTIFISITYSLIFGAMFGDVGQGLLLLIGGFLLYHFKKSSLAGIISTAGFFSTIFGFMFGSVFGFEDIIEPVWLRPVSSMSSVPFIGKLNTVFIIAIGFGMFMILVTMVLHIINAAKSHEIGNMLFDTNGLAGLVFYGSLVAVVTLFMTDNHLPAAIVLLIMFVLPLLLIALKEPLTNLITKKDKLIEGGKGMFITQAFFELFEVLLSYFSNTLSFVRIGAFAVSHAAMMEVVLMLAGAENGSAGNMVVIVIGNLFVCGMEGLIVGIQVLRLEYYEMFSRFYKGSGREFKPYSKLHK